MSEWGDSAQLRDRRDVPQVKGDGCAGPYNDASLTMLETAAPDQTLTMLKGSAAPDRTTGRTRPLSRGRANRGAGARSDGEGDDSGEERQETMFARTAGHEQVGRGGATITTALPPGTGLGRRGERHERKLDREQRSSHALARGDAQGDVNVRGSQ